MMRTWARQGNLTAQKVGVVGVEWGGGENEGAEIGNAESRASRDGADES